MKVFLDQANFDNEQLTNLTALMNVICRPNEEYPVSSNIDVDKYSSNNTLGKEYRCRAIEDAMDALYPVLKRAAFNKSEPLDFSNIIFYTNASDSTSYYNVTDLINTSWIKSDVPVDYVCVFTNFVKDYAMNHTSNSTAQDRSLQNKSFVNTLIDLIDRILDPVLGLQKRFYWEGNHRLEQVYSGLANQLGNLRDGIGKGFSKTRSQISSIFSSSANSTVSKSSNTFNATSVNLTTTGKPASWPTLNGTVKSSKPNDKTYSGNESTFKPQSSNINITIS